MYHYLRKRFDAELPTLTESDRIFVSCACPVSYSCPAMGRISASLCGSAEAWRSSSSYGVVLVSLRPRDAKRPPGGSQGVARCTSGWDATPRVSRPLGESPPALH
jgi:hypothetical protein